MSPSSRPSLVSSLPVPPPSSAKAPTSGMHLRPLVEMMLLRRRTSAGMLAAVACCLILAAAAVSLFFFLCFRYRAVVINRVFFAGGTWRNLELKVEKKGRRFQEDCDLFDGEWVWDKSYPLYEFKDCRFLDEGFRCSKNGRPDNLCTNLDSYSVGEEVPHLLPAVANPLVPFLEHPLIEDDVRLHEIYRRLVLINSFSENGISNQELMDIVSIQMTIEKTVEAALVQDGFDAANILLNMHNYQVAVPVGSQHPATSASATVAVIQAGPVRPEALLGPGLGLKFRLEVQAGLARPELMGLNFRGGPT